MPLGNAVGEPYHVLQYKISDTFSRLSLSLFVSGADFRTSHSPLLSASTHLHVKGFPLLSISSAPPNTQPISLACI